VIIRRLRIGDFGIIRDQVMDGIGSGINIVGGPNRAGKTTLMQVLRYLGYDLPQGSGILPPATNEYQIKAAVEDEEGNTYSIQRSGFANPVISAGSEDGERALHELYHISAFTYRQLFTISLEELRRLPDGVESKDSAELQSVLLGAGMADVAQIPEIIEEFKRGAHRIGGKYGKKDVGDFKQANQRIQEAVADQEEALKQVDRYQKKRQELDKCVAEIEELENTADQLEFERDRLDFLQQQFDSFQEWERLDTQLQRKENQEVLAQFRDDKIDLIRDLFEKYEEVYSDFQKQKSEFLRIIPPDQRERWYNYMYSLVENRDEIKHWERHASGLDQRLENYQENLTEQTKREHSIEEKLRSLNENWGNDFTVLDDVETDQMSTGALRQVVSDFRKYEDKTDTLERELREYHEEISAKESHLESLNDPALEKNNRTIAVIGGGMVLLGIILGIFLQPWLGITVGIAGGLISGGALVVSYLLNSEERRQVRVIMTEIEQLTSRRNEVKNELGEIRGELGKKEAILRKYREMLGLSDDIHPESVLQFYQDATVLKEEIARWRSNKEQLHEKREVLEEELENLHNLLTPFVPVPESLKSFEEGKRLSEHLETVLERSEIANTLHSVIEERGSLEERIRDLLSDGNGEWEVTEPPESPEQFLKILRNYIQEGERYRELINMRDQRDQYKQLILNAITEKVRVAIFRTMEEEAPEAEITLGMLAEQYEPFVSKESINGELTQVRERFDTIRDDLDEHRDTRSRLEVELENLATSERLVQAQERIDRARSQLEPLAREYAVNRVAELILDEVRERFMERTRDELLSDASEIFRRITSGDYSMIAPTDRVIDADFVSVEHGGKSVSTTDYLSRGTQEQLFLSVRLSRIQEIDPPLPVILDDSLVNFDTEHRKQAARVVSELATRNQVFVLTCHPEIVQLLGEAGEGTTYWTVDEGRIEKSDYEQVIGLLG